MTAGPPTVYAIEQALTVRRMLDSGSNQRQIAEALGVTPARVSQVARTLRELAPYLGPRPNGPTERLRSIRDQLETMRHEALVLSMTLRRDLRVADNELTGRDVDRILGLD